MFRVLQRELFDLLRDRSNLFFIILFPSLLVFLLGNLLAFLDNPDVAVGTLEIGYTVETEDPATVAGIDTFVKALNETEGITLVKSDDFSAVKTSVNNQKSDAGAVFREPFDIEVYQGLTDVKNRATEMIFRGFARQYSAIAASYEVNPEKAQAAVMSDSVSAGALLKDYDLGYTRSMLDYYAVTMIVMIMFMGGAIGGAATLYEDRMNHTLARVVVSPRSRASIYIQTVIGKLPQSLLQVLSVMLVSTLFFGAHYADTFLSNILLFIMLLLASMAICAVAMVLGMLVKFNPTALLMSITWVLLFLSGSFSKEVSIPGFTDYSPPYLLQAAAFDLTVFGREGKCLIAVAVSAAILIIATLVGAKLFNRKGFAI
jgi:ABC-2 type transport system permease protein